MGITNHLNRIVLLILFLIFLCNLSFAQTFDVSTTDELMQALQEATSGTESWYLINVNANVGLNETLNLRNRIAIIGNSTLTQPTLSFNNYRLLYDDVPDQYSSLENLTLLYNGNASTISVNNQALSITKVKILTGSSGTNNAMLICNNGSIYAGDVTLENTAGGSGSAIANNNNGRLTLDGGSIEGFRAVAGGAMILEGKFASIIDTTISENSASAEGGALYVIGNNILSANAWLLGNSAGTNGGAIYADNAKIELHNTQIYNNTAAKKGGAIYVESGTTVQSNYDNFTNNSVTGQNGLGGAVYNLGTTIVNKTFFNTNKAESGSGGAIYNQGTMTITGAKFDNNMSKVSGGAIFNNGSLNVQNVTFSNNQSNTGGAFYSSDSNPVFSENVSFIGNNSERDGGGLYINSRSHATITGGAQFLGNTSNSGQGGGIFVEGGGILDINANDPEKSVIFSDNHDRMGTNAFHIGLLPNRIADESTTRAAGYGEINLNVSNGASIRIEDNVSGTDNSQLNLNGTSSVDDHIYFGSANNNFNGGISANNINLHFYNLESGMPNGLMTATNTHFDLINGAIGQTPLNLNLTGGGNELSIDVDPANLTSDFIQMNGDPAVMSTLVIRDINLLSNPVQSTTIFDLYDHKTYGTNLKLSDKIKNATVYDALKAYKWSLTPKLTLTEIVGKCNPNIQRYQAATAAAYMNQMLSFDYSLNRTDEIYMNLRAQKLAGRKMNSYAFVGQGGMYVDYYDESGAAFWIRPYVNLENFYLSGAFGSLKNQSYGLMFGFDFPMVEKNDWKLFSTIYGSYIGSSQQYLESNMNQNGGYGGYLLSVYKNDFYAGWTINGGGVGVHSAYLNGSDNYGIVTAGTALKLAYNWKLRDRWIIQPNFTTSYLYLDPSNLVNFQAVNMNQSMVNGLVIAPSMRITYRNETGIEPYIFGGCVIPIMSDVKARVNNFNIDKLTLNSWAQFGAGLRKRFSERVTTFLETVVRTGGRYGWGFMFNIEIKL